MKITIIAGARPNFMKIAPITWAIKQAKEQGKEITYRLIYTGRKEDISIEPSLFTDLNMNIPNGYLNVESNNDIELAANIMIAFDKELATHPTDVVLVVDDLTATMSCAIVAKKRGLKVAHLIAGTRSFDLNMPKEVSRMITDGLSDYFFTAGETANRNLSHTGTEQDNVFHVGNILIDTLRRTLSQMTKPAWFSTLDLKKNNYLLFTLNRRVLTSNLVLLRQLMEILINKSQGMPIIAPLHTYAAEALRSTEIVAPNLHILPTQNYLNFVYLMNNAHGIITDSGNIAEETTFLDIPCITLNNFSEHPETCQMGTNELVGEDPERFSQALDKLKTGNWKKRTLPERWDGRTADRIIQTLLNKGN